MKHFIKKFIGEIILTGGIGLFAYSIFNFSYKTYGSEFLLNGELAGMAYYYHSVTLLMIAIGAILITVGVLIIRNRQKHF